MQFLFQTFWIPIFWMNSFCFMIFGPFKSQVFPWSDPRHSAVEWPMGCAWAFLGALQQPELSEAPRPDAKNPLVYIAMEHHHFWWVNQLLSSIIIYYHLLSSIIIYYHLLSSIIIYYHLLSSIIIYYHLLSSIINYFSGHFDSYFDITRG